MFLSNLVIMKQFKKHLVVKSFFEILAFLSTFTSLYVFITVEHIGIPLWISTAFFAFISIVFVMYILYNDFVIEADKYKEEIEIEINSLNTTKTILKVLIGFTEHNKTKKGIIKDIKSINRRITHLRNKYV